MKRAIVDFTKDRGTIGPQHCLNFASRGGREYVKPLHVGLEEQKLYARLCGNATGYGKSVDIPYIFRKFDADANDPASYYLVTTDAIMADVATYAEKIIYVLTAPRENYEPHYYCVVPKDMEKWAEVVCNIIRHYNDGLWNGFRYGIGAFEIWNRPDDPAFWDGTKEEYFALYTAAATKIKNLDASYRVGVSFSLIDEKGFSFAEDFLGYVKEKGLPLDFLGFHASEADVDSVAHKVARLRDLLNEQGLQPELIQAGWACVDERKGERARFEHLRDAQGAAYASAVMSVMQEYGVDASIVSEARAAAPNAPLLDWYGEIQKPYYSMLAFKSLYDLGKKVKAKGFGLYVTAAKDGDGHGAILLTKFSDDSERGELLAKGLGAFRATYKTLDETRDLSVTKVEEYSGGDAHLAVEFRGYSTVLIEIEAI